LSPTRWKLIAPPGFTTKVAGRAMLFPKSSTPHFWITARLASE
jgi:hypothetical protein